MSCSLSVYWEVSEVLHAQHPQHLEVSRARVVPHLQVQILRACGLQVDQAYGGGHDMCPPLRANLASIIDTVVRPPVWYRKQTRSSPPSSPSFELNQLELSFLAFAEREEELLNFGVSGAPYVALARG